MDPSVTTYKQKVQSIFVVKMVWSCRIQHYVLKSVTNGLISP